MRNIDRVLRIGIIMTLFFVAYVQNSAGQEISQHLVGSNYWYQLWDKPEVMSIVEDGSFDIIRIGGNGYNRTFPDNATVEEWVNEVKGFGAEPLLQVSAFDTPEEVAAVVQYFNIDNDNYIKFWAIGNEPDLNNEMTTPEMYEYIVSHATAMKAVDSTIILFVPDLAGPHFEHLNRLVGGDLDVTGLKQNSYFLIDGISWHRYAFWEDYDREDVMDRVKTGLGDPARQLINLMDAANATHGRTGENELKWGIGEFNINVALEYGVSDLYSSVEGIGTNSFLNGQFYAEIYDMCMREEAFYATSWSIHESGGGRGPGDLGLIDGSSDAPQPRSNFYHSKLVAENIRGTYLPATLNQNLVTVFGGKHSDADSIGIMILNKEENTNFDFTLRLDTNAFVQSNNLEINVDAGLNIEYTGSIAPQSTQVLIFDTSGVFLKRVVYSLTHAIGNLAPTILGPGQDTVIAAISAGDNAGCISTPTEFKVFLSGTVDSIKWDFGEGATPSFGIGANPIEVSFESVGLKTIKLYQFYNNKCDTLIFSDFIEIDSCNRKPYNGERQVIPGVVQGVFFDEGANGIAYYDVDEGNNGTGPRQDTDVDTENGDADGNIGWTEPGEWLEYTIDITETMLYKAEVNYASSAGGGTLKILFDGIDKTGNVDVPSTGSWSSYKTLTINQIDLTTADSVIMRVEIVNDGFNFSSLTFSEYVPTGINKSTISSNVKLYPNPANDVVNILIADEGVFNALNIYTIDGRLQYSEPIINVEEISVDLNNFTSGLYIINLSGEKNYTNKFIVE